jgi:transglutaminase-like putative cysteine protease
MPFNRWVTASLYLLVLDAVAGLLATPILDLPGFVAMAAAVLVAGWADRRRLGLPLPRRLWNLIPGLFLLLLMVDYFLLASSFLAALSHLFLLLVAYKLFDLNTNRDILWIYLFTFILLFIAATQTTSVAFLGVFVGYLVLGTWSWILFQLKRETETALPGEGPVMLARTRVVTPRFMASSLGLALGCFLITLALFFLIPRVGLTVGIGTAQRGARTSGYADRVSLEAGPIQLDSTVVMRVAFPHGPDSPERLPLLRWRGSSLDAFSGTAWFQGDFLLKPIPERRGREFALSRLEPGEPLLVQEIFLEPIGGRQLFAAPRLLSLRGPFRDLHLDSGDGITVLAEIERPLRYLAFSQPNPPRPEQLRAAGTDVPPEIGERYLALPAVSPRVTALAREIAGSAPTPYDAALRLERYLTTQLVYRLGVTLAPGTDPLEDFLFTQRRGHCEYFATSMAVLLRILGIPSRVVTGFQRGEWNEMGKFYTVRQRDAHSWVEAYFPGSGWVAFDPSPRREFESRLFEPVGWVAEAVELLRMRWTRYVVEYNLGDQLSLAASLRRQVQRSSLALARAWNRLASDARGALWELAGAAALVAAGFCLAALLLLRRRGDHARSRFRKELPASRVVFYERMLRLLARRGILRQPASTAREFAQGLTRHPTLHGPVAELTGLYERVRFGQEQLARADEQRAFDLLGALRSVMLEDAGPGGKSRQ